MDRINDPKYLVGYWPLNGNTSEPIHGNNACWYATPNYAENPFGKLAANAAGGISSLTVKPLNGDGSTPLSSATGFTYMMWVKIVTVTGNAAIMYMLYDNNTYATNGTSFFRLGGTSFAIYANNAAPKITWAGPPAIGEWYHFAITLKDPVISLVVNGVEVGNNTYTGSVTPDKFQMADTQLIWNIRVYNCTLTPEEIRKIYIREKASSVSIVRRAPGDFPVTKDIAFMMWERGRNGTSGLGRAQIGINNGLPSTLSYPYRRPWYNNIDNVWQLSAAAASLVSGYPPGNGVHYWGDQHAFPNSISGDYGTIMVVLNPGFNASEANDRQIIRMNTIGILWNGTTNRFNATYGGTTLAPANASTHVYGDRHIIIYRFAPGSQDLRINGVQVATGAGATTTVGATMAVGYDDSGANKYMSSATPAIIVHNRHIEDDDVLKMEAWATTNCYNGPLTLPVTSMAVWYSSYQFTGAGAIATWTDLSMNGRNAAQATGVNQPIVVLSALNGLPIVDFTNDGNNKYMASGAFTWTNTSQSAFAIVRNTWQTLPGLNFCHAWASNGYASTVGRGLMATRTTSGVLGVIAKSLIMDGDGYNSGRAPNYHTVSYDVAWPDNAWKLIYSTLNTPACSMRVDRADIAAYETNAGIPPALNAGIYLGTRAGAQFWDNRMAEIIIYFNELTTAERNALEAYSLNVWGV